MDDDPRDTLAVVDKDIYHFAVRTVLVGIVSQATGFIELGSQRNSPEIDLLYDIGGEACLASFFVVHDNSLR